MPSTEVAAAVDVISQVDKLAARGLVDGRPDPKAPVTWEELATVLNRVLDRRAK